MKALRDLDAVDSKGSPGKIERAVIDVTIDGVTEVVSFGLREGRLSWASTAGAQGAPFVEAALRFLAGAGDPIGEYSSIVDTKSGSISTVRRLEDDPPAPTDRGSVSQTLTDLVTAVARAGVKVAATSPSVEECVERLVAVLPTPTPLGASRFIGRLRSALSTGNVDVVARLLEGATRLVADLQSESPTVDGRRRIMTFLGSINGEVAAEPLTDRLFLEVAREWLPGRQRAAIERRYLLDLGTGEVLREERGRGSAPASVGPCPRLLSVGLGEAEESAPLRRVRLLQYAITSGVRPQHWSAVVGASIERFGALADDYRRSVAAFPGLAEPFALISPAACENGPSGPVLLDDQDTPLPLAVADDPSLSGSFAALTSGRTPRFVAGRLVDAAGSLMLVPLSFGVEEGGQTRFVRLA